VAQLGARIAEDGALVQRLVVSYDEAESREVTLSAELDATQARLAADRQAQARATATLRGLALTSYMGGAGAGTATTLFDTRNVTTLAARQQYAQVATAQFGNAIDAVEVDAGRTQSSEAQLRAAQAQAAAGVQQLSAARGAAQAALVRDDSLLSQAQGNLQVLLAAQAAQRAAAAKIAEQAMAAQAAAAAAAAHPVTVTLHPSPGTYADPLRGLNALTPERIDQGVDYSGYGPVYALGDGVVLSTVNAGWPGGTFISYRLADGPAGGLVVYVAEDIDPVVTVGQAVDAGTVLGLVYEGPDGIETGWADPSGNGVSMANDAGQFSGANSTVFGASFSRLLASVGAPPGVAQNEPPTGTLPPGWPAL